jgi:hypothetical protein
MSGLDEKPGEKVETPSEKLVPTYDIDGVKDRSALSEAIAPVSERGEKTAKAVQNSGLPPTEQGKAFELVEPVVSDTGIPEGAAAIPYITKKLEHEILTNPNAANSRFMQGAYALFKVLGGIFGFALTSSDYSSFTSALYPTAKIDFKDDAQIKEFLSAREKLKLLDDYHKAKVKLGTEVKDEEKQKLQAELDRLKLEIKANFTTDGDDPDALYEKYLAKNKEALTSEELKKFKDTEHADAQASCYYVQEQLGILGLVKEDEKGNENYDPEVLLASFNREAYYKDSAAEYSTKFFKPETDFNRFMTAHDTGTLHAGTVMFFNWAIGDNKTETMCGIVGLDGKIRFQDSKKLHTFYRGKTPGEQYRDRLLDGSDTNEKEGDVDLNELSGSFLGLGNMLPTTSFLGAYIPETIQGDARPKKEEEKTTEGDKTEEKKAESEKPEDKKSETEKPKEEPKAES